MKVEFHPAADSELRAAASYYEDRVLGLGDEFLADVERACYVDHRRLALRRFPFGLIYRLSSSKVQMATS